MKKIIKPAVILLLIYMVAFQPQQTAEAVQSIVGVLGDVANGTAQFITTLI